MQVYAVPGEVAVPGFEDSCLDGRYDREQDDRVTNEFLAELKAWLVEHGYNRKLTGEIVSFPIADGAAQYMVAEGKSTILVHLPIHDAWNIPAAHMRGLRKKDIVEQVERSRRIAAMFAEKD